MANLVEKINGDKVMQFSTKETAAAIRAALKVAFPGFKFSVTFERYSMGSCTNVSWTDGPTSPEVRLVTDRFTSQSFDGMTDSTSYHTQTVDGRLVQYSGSVSVHRTASIDLINLAKRRAKLMGEENVYAVMHTMRPNGCRVMLKEAVGR